MGIIVKCAALNVVTILLAAFTMITAIVAITPPRWLTFRIFQIHCGSSHNFSKACDSRTPCSDRVADDDAHNLTGYSGIWQRCFDISGANAAFSADACYSIGDANPEDGSMPNAGYLWAVRITYIVSLVSWTVGIVLLIPWFSFEKKKQEKMFKLSSASFFLMAVLIFCSLLVFSAAHRSYCSTWTDAAKEMVVVELQEQSWAFQVAIISIIFAVFAGGVSLLAAFKMELSAKDGRERRATAEYWKDHSLNVSTAAPSTSTSQFSNIASNPNLTPSYRPTPTPTTPIKEGESNSGFDVAA